MIRGKTIKLFSSVICDPCRGLYSCGNNDQLLAFLISQLVNHPSVCLQLTSKKRSFVDLEDQRLMGIFQPIHRSLKSRTFGNSGKLPSVINVELFAWRKATCYQDIPSSQIRKTDNKYTQGFIQRLIRKLETF